MVAPVIFEAHSALKAGARERTWITATFSRRMRAARRKALTIPRSGFLVCTGMGTNSAPDALRSLTMRPPEEATMARPPARITASATSSVDCSAPPVSSEGTTCRRVKFGGSVAKGRAVLRRRHAHSQRKRP
jgi:hypothetical protein